jgi:hypothetical protein
MRARIHDLDTLRSIRPEAVAAYLRARGWTLTETKRAFTRFERREDRRTFEVEVPRTTDYGDYALRTAEVLGTLEVAEKRSQLEILQDLTAAGADVIRLRLIGESVEDGTLSLADAATLVDATRDLLLASACAAHQPRAFYGPRNPDEARTYLEGLRFGQTERGSFAMRVVSPVPPLLTPSEAGLLFPEAEQAPFQRRATETLIKASHASAEAAALAGQTGSLGPFEKGIGAGVSANFCSSLARILSLRSDTHVEISVDWASNRPAPDPARKIVRLDRNMARVLETASQELKARAPKEDFELVGYIVALDSSDASRGGAVTIAGQVDGRIKKVRVILDSPDYGRAASAHTTMTEVTVTGRLQKVGRQFELSAPSGFLVLGED